MRSIFKKFRLPIIVIGITIIIGLALIFGLRKTVTVTADGQTWPVTSYAFKVADLLHSQAIAVSPSDSITPSLDSWLKNGQTITLVRAVPVQILVDGKLTSLVSPQRIPTDLLSQAGVVLQPADELLSNGKPVDKSQPFPLDVLSIPLQVIRAVSFNFNIDGQDQKLISAAPILGSALWTAGYSLFNADQLIPPVDTPLTQEMTATLVRSNLLTVQTEFGDVAVRTSASTVGAALQAANLSPQGLDYSIPSASEPIPSNRAIRLVRVTEQVLTEQTPIPFETEFQPVSDLDLDSQSVVQAGEYGITAQRVRVRFEDGQEASRQTEGEWVARQPQPRIIGYGTNVVMHTTTVDGVTIQYWRAVSMYATSYHPSEVGDTTASGLPLQKGVAAVDTRLIPFYTQLYIPGYGEAVAADIGGAVVGRWIDLGYSDDDYVPWHSWVTVYFLWPPPDNIAWTLP